MIWNQQFIWCDEINRYTTLPAFPTSLHLARKEVIIMGVLDPLVPDLSNIMPDTKMALAGSEATTFLSPLFELMRARSHDDVGSIQPVQEGLDAYYIDDVLSHSECNCIMELMHKNSHLLSFWNAAGREHEEARLFRDADTIEIHSDTFGELLWERIARYVVDKRLEYTENDESPELVGCWSPSTTNRDLLLAHYPSGGHFAPHTDGNAIETFNKRSMYSIIVYLNTIEDGGGGGTRFFDKDAVHHLNQDDCGRWRCPPEHIQATVSPIRGRLLFFHQDLVHEGVALGEGLTKAIIRSDVMYTRSPPVCDRPIDREAYALYREGEILAEKGMVKESIAKMRKALKMSRELAVHMGQ